MKKIICTLIVLIILVAYSCSESKVLKDSSPEKVEISAERLLRIDNMLQESIENGWIAGAVGFIARDGKIVYNRAFGISDFETKAPMQTDNIFRICSQTKAITSIAL